MMEWLDHFVDTRKKRYHLYFLILLIVWMVLLLPYLYIGIRLLQLQSYDALYSLLDDAILQDSYLSRVILQVISMAEFSIPRLCKIIVACVHPLELFAAVLTLCSYTILERKKATMIALVLLCVEAVLTLACVGFGVNADSLSQAILCVRVLGGVLVFVNGCFLILCGYHLYRRIRYYKHALSYACIEEKEHAEQES